MWCCTSILPWNLSTGRLIYEVVIKLWASYLQDEFKPHIQLTRVRQLSFFIRLPDRSENGLRKCACSVHLFPVLIDSNAVAHLFHTSTYSKINYPTLLDFIQPLFGGEYRRFWALWEFFWLSVLLRCIILCVMTVHANPGTTKRKRISDMKETYRWMHRAVVTQITMCNSIKPNVVPCARFRVVVSRNRANPLFRPDCRSQHANDPIRLIRSRLEKHG